MRYKDVSEITEAFIGDGWNADIKFTELSVDNAAAIGSFFAGLIKQGHKLFQMSGSGNIFDDSGKLIFLNLSFQAEMQKAISLIENFCLEEYGSLPDFSNYRRIGVAYTTVTDAELELQVNANLIDYSIDTYLDGKLFQRNSYNSLKELISQELEWLSFDSLIAYSDQEIF